MSLFLQIFTASASAIQTCHASFVVAFSTTKEPLLHLICEEFVEDFYISIRFCIEKSFACDLRAKIYGTGKLFNAFLTQIINKSLLPHR